MVPQDFGHRTSRQNFCFCAALETINSTQLVGRDQRVGHGAVWIGSRLHVYLPSVQGPLDPRSHSLQRLLEGLRTPQISLTAMLLSSSHTPDSNNSSFSSSSVPCRRAYHRSDRWSSVGQASNRRRARWRPIAAEAPGS